jgi:flavodoxin
VQFEEDSKKMLEALKNIEALKNAKMTTVKSSGKTWIEYEGNIDIPDGSKAFLALLKRKDGNDPYNIFLRIDINKEADTRERAEKETREWIAAIFAEPLKRAMRITEMQIGTPLEIIKGKRTRSRSNIR